MDFFSFYVFIFSESLFEVNHLLMFCNSWFTFWNKYPISWWIRNKSFFKSVAAFCKWLLYNRNRRCPKIESYGTPHLNFFFFIDLSELSPILEVALNPILCRGVKTNPPPPAFRKQPPILGNPPSHFEKFQNPPSLTFEAKFSSDLIIYSWVWSISPGSTLTRTLSQFHSHLVILTNNNTHRVQTNPNKKQNILLFTPST